MGSVASVNFHSAVTCMGDSTDMNKFNYMSILAIMEIGLPQNLIIDLYAVLN